MSIVRQHAPFPTIDKQEVNHKYDENGNLGKHWRIHVTHSNGTKSWIEVPDENYVPEYIAKLLQDEANRVLSVENLRSAPPEHHPTPAT